MSIEKIYHQMLIGERELKRKELETCIIPFCHGKAVKGVDICGDHLWEVYQKGGLVFK